MNQMCAQCGAIGFHSPGCTLGQITAPLQQTAQSAAAIRGEVGAVHGDMQTGFGALHADVQSGFGAVQHQLQIGNVLAIAALGVQVQQLGHLRSIDAAVGRLAYNQERQAALTQVLFELQQKLAFLTTLARSDAFAAGIYARLFLQSLESAQISVEAFEKLEYKHQFATAVGHLRSTWGVLAARPDMVRRADAFLAAAREAANWQNTRVPDDAQVGAMLQRAAQVRADHDRAVPAGEERTATLYKRLALLGAAFVVLLLLWIPVAIFGSGELSKALGGLFGFGIAGTVLTAIVLYWQHDSTKTGGIHPDDVEREAFAAKALLDRYRAFASHPEGARLVDDVLRAHPSLRVQ